MQNIIYLALGGISGLIVAAVYTKKNPSKWNQQIKNLEKENTKLRNERRELKTKVTQNTDEISLIKDALKQQEEQILLCHKYLSKMTDFRSEVDLQNHVVASDRFRKHFDILVKKPNANVPIEKKDERP